MNATERGAMVRKLGEAVEARAEQLAQVETRDNGKRLVDILPGLTSL